jgi:hypothetical protein
MAAYTVNEDAVRHAKRLIDARRYVLRSRWQDVQPCAPKQNAFLKTHSWEEYAAWHLGLTEGAVEETKGRYAFVYGDFRRLHRMGLIACHYPLSLEYERVYGVALRHVDVSAEGQSLRSGEPLCPDAVTP